MTQAARARADVRRPGAIYGINLLDPDTMTIRMDYVGQTRQRGRAREMQHRDDKPWEDLIIGSPALLAEGMWTQRELDAQEKQAIARIRPRMNYEHNLDNPERIEIWRQKQQRWTRDDQAGRPRWVPLEERVPVGLLDQPTRIPAPRAAAAPVAAKRWRPWQVKACLWSATWTLLILACWAFAHQHELGHGWLRLACCAGAALALQGWSLLRPIDTVELWRERAAKVIAFLRSD